MKAAKSIIPIRRAANPSKEKISALPELPALSGKVIKADLPLALQPQLATLVDGSPSDPAEWAFEIKFAGYRILTRIGGKKFSRYTMYPAQAHLWCRAQGNCYRRAADRNDRRVAPVPPHCIGEDATEIIHFTYREQSAEIAFLQLDSTGCGWDCKMTG